MSVEPGQGGLGFPRQRVLADRRSRMAEQQLQQAEFGASKPQGAAIEFGHAAGADLRPPATSAWSPGAAARALQDRANPRASSRARVPAHSRRRPVRARRCGRRHRPGPSASAPASDSGPGCRPGPRCRLPCPASSRRERRCHGCRRGAAATPWAPSCAQVTTETRAPGSSRAAGRGVPRRRPRATPVRRADGFGSVLCMSRDTLIRHDEVFRPRT